VCHEKDKITLGLHARCVVGRLERAMAINAILKCQIEYYRQDLISASILNGHSSGPSIAHET